MKQLRNLVDNIEHSHMVSATANEDVIIIKDEIKKWVVKYGGKLCEEFNMLASVSAEKLKKWKVNEVDKEVLSKYKMWAMWRRIEHWTWCTYVYGK